MPTIEVIENPRRRRRRKLTAKQLAAGFGGKRKMTTSRKRRNPGLATIAANPRRRRKSYGHRNPRRYKRRHRNPMLGGVTGFTKLISIKSAVSVGVGITTAHLAPNLIGKVWAGAPTTGIGGAAVRMGTVLVLGTGVKMLMKDNQVAMGIVAGGIGYEVYKFLAENVVPKIGFLSGYQYIDTGELEQYGVSGYMPNNNTMGQVIDPVLAA